MKGLWRVVELVCILLGLSLLLAIRGKDGLSIFAYRQSLCDGRGRQIETVQLNFSFRTWVGAVAGGGLLVCIIIPPSVFVRHYVLVKVSDMAVVVIATFAPRKSLDL